MKSGLMVYQPNKDNIFNIGDYIQSLAAEQFFEDKDFMFLNREYLNEYSGENIKLIMNGWFMHQPQNWPPSSSIKPLFVSFHMNSLAKNELLRTKNIEYFKLHEPIGCRDHDTVNLLRNKGVDAYFTGCMTLTLGQTYKNGFKVTDKIYFVDAHYETSKRVGDILRILPVLLHNYSVVKEICKKRKGKISIKNLISITFFYFSYIKIFTQDVLKDAEYIEQEITDDFLSENEKFEYAKSLLNKYSEAKYVITSRIHCALPCLALETPVLYIENVNQSEASYCRLNGLRELFNIISYNKGRMETDIIKSGRISKKTVLKIKNIIRF